MKRRSFVLLTGVAISAIAVPTWYYKYRDLEYDPILTEPELLSYIWDGNTILETGKIYRERFPDENSERKLVELLTTNISSDQAAVNEMLRLQITTDYESGNTVMVDGWILSKTEARQCALFAVTQNK